MPRGIAYAVFSEDGDSVGLQQGRGHPLPRYGGAAEVAVVDAQAAAGRAAFLEDRDAGAVLLRDLERGAGTGEERLGDVGSVGGEHAGLTGEHGGAAAAAFDLGRGP